MSYLYSLPEGISFEHFCHNFALQLGGPLSSREEFDHPAFLYVSDDMEWGRRHLHGEQGDLFFVGSDDSSDFGVGADLAVLALSNATVISRGTFSMFAAVLQGGWYHTEYGVIVPDELMNPDLYQDDLIL